MGLSLALALRRFWGPRREPRVGSDPLGITDEAELAGHGPPACPGSAGCPRFHQGEASDGDVYGGPLALHSGALTYTSTPLAI